MTATIDRVTALLREAAALHLLPRWRHLDPDDISHKAGGEMVTAADLAAEEWLTPRLTDLVPGSIVIGEEAAADDPSLLGAGVGAEAVWFLDPLDGTRLFAGGKPDFATIVALHQRGETRLGWIYEPATGQLSVGERGAGVAIDGRPIHLLAVDGEALTGFGSRRFQQRAAGFPELIAEIGRAPCAGVQYRSLLQGQAQFSIYGRLMPWDHAAGVLMVAEAGGVSADFDAQPYDPIRPATTGLLNATDAALWQRLRDALAAD